MKMREWIEGDSGEITVMGDFNLGEMDCWGDIQIEDLCKRRWGERDRNRGENNVCTKMGE